MLPTASITDITTTIFSILDMHPSTFHHMTAPPSAPQWFTSQSETATIPPGFTPTLQHPSFHQQQQAGFGPTQFVQPMAPGPQAPTSNSQWMTGPASTQAATMFAPQEHTMHQPPLQGHYDVPAPIQLGHATPASHHGHLIQQHIPQQLQPPQPQPTAFTSPPPHTFMLRPLLLPPHPPMHTFHNNNNNINHHHHNNSHHRRISHSPPP